MPAPSPLPTYLYKILDVAPPSPLPERLPLSDLDKADGFLHLSTSTQVPGTADAYFSSYTELWLLKIEYKVLANGIDGNGEKKEDAKVQWDEVGRGTFAHYYAADLGSGNVKESVKVVKKEGGTWVESLDLEW
ncbi:hypothetical protein K504DRAFT_1964 [Pleomassaria siparia CBS 279.74]|uniref:DUF952-domain-containing protein n=1 Tax=Pleomassaria siparia CBS 279.74 TaxID=1314801 RepID=A0A6G1KND9_9PLEO|nr:hypothetical protein K504DRAFT_1964 [Pleomassaria siparia CBS 279.74]